MNPIPPLVTTFILCRRVTQSPDGRYNLHDVYRISDEVNQADNHVAAFIVISNIKHQMTWYVVAIDPDDNTVFVGDAIHSVTDSPLNTMSVIECIPTSRTAGVGEYRIELHHNGVAIAGQTLLSMIAEIDDDEPLKAWPT